MNKETIDVDDLLEDSTEGLGAPAAKPTVASKQSKAISKWDDVEEELDDLLGPAFSKVPAKPVKKEVSASPWVGAGTSSNKPSGGDLWGKPDPGPSKAPPARSKTTLKSSDWNTGGEYDPSYKPSPTASRKSKKEDEEDKFNSILESVLGSDEKKQPPAQAKRAKSSAFRIEDEEFADIEDHSKQLSRPGTGPSAGSGRGLSSGGGLTQEQIQRRKALFGGAGGSASGSAGDGGGRGTPPGAV